MRCSPSSPRTLPHAGVEGDHPMAARESTEKPFLQGNFGPWREEGVAPDLEVIGELPKELSGTFYRNGPNPAFEPPGRYHWFDGDGMIHAIHLENGRASYRNRWVRSHGLEAERAAGTALHGHLRSAAERDPDLQEHGQHAHRLARRP